MTGQHIKLIDQKRRALAHSLIDAAPDDYMVNIYEPKRNLEQNALMWVLLSDVSRSKPEGRSWTTEVWKCAFLHSLGYQCQFEQALDGQGMFTMGMRTSRLSKAQMSDLIEVIYEYGSRHGVVWSERREVTE